MNVLKAYANRPVSTSPRLSFSDRGAIAGGTEREKKVNKSSGDVLSLSREAMDRLRQNHDALSVCPQDATYDQNGYVMRQVENVRGDLRQLSAHLMAYPESAALTGQLRAMQRQLGSIQAQV